jgi:lipopolysaccharide transport system ATP-binding protein
VSSQGTGDARCTAIALCDESGRATDVFQMGDLAVFYYEFDVDKPLEVPVGGVSLVNERNLIVHGRNTVQHMVPPCEPVPAGSRLRFRQRMRLDVAPGRYTFVVGLVSMRAEDYAQAAHMSHASLHERTTRVLSIANVASFTVTMRRDGLELPFHGLCNLGGDAALAVMPPATIPS